MDGQRTTRKKRSERLAARIAVIGGLLVAAVPGLGSQFHVATNGTAGGNGSAAQPWNLQTALNAPGAVQPGDTIWVHGGTYYGTYSTRLNGSSSRPIVVRNYNGDRVTIDGGNSNGAPIFTVDGSYTWYWGFEIMSSATNKISAESTSWPTDIMFGEGVMIAQGGSGGTGCKFINLVVHDTRQGFSSWKEAANSEVYGCVVYDNGWMAPDRPHGHNMYIQNVSGTKHFADNIILRAYSHNIQSYGSDASNEDNEIFEGNVGVNGGERNFMLGGDNVSQNPVFRDNFMYADGARAGSNVFYLGYPTGYSPGTNNAVVTGNYIAGGNLTFNKNANMTFTGNTIYYTAMSGDVPSMAGNTATTTKPSANAIYVRRNSYEPGRANIVVFNWNDLNSVSVDVSSVLQNGDSYVVRDAQNYYGSPVASGTYNGGALQIPMTSASVPPTVGNDPRGIAHTSKEFGCFVLIGSTNAQYVSGALSATPASLAYPGGSSTLSWSSQNATSASIDQGIGTVATNGSRTVQVSATTTFTLTLNGPGGPVTSKATITVAPPPVSGSPALSSPACNAVNVSLPVTLSWSPVTGATAYEVSVALDSTFAAPLYSNTNVATTSVQVSGLGSGTEYYWRARGKNGSGTGNYSSAWWFTTAAGQAPPPLPLALLGTPPEQGTVTLNLQKPPDAQMATISLCVFDADGAEEGSLSINGRNTLTLFGDIAAPSRDNCATVFTLTSPASDWNDGANVLTFSHTATGGYRVDSVAVSFNAPLPIQLATFSAVRFGADMVTLTWSTLSETNNYGFYVQRSSHPDAGFARINANIVPGHGTTVERHDYTFADESRASGSLYYRLEQVDLDGSSHYSEPIQPSSTTAVDPASLPLSAALYQNYPNPFNPSTTIEFDLPHAAFTTLTLYDALGAEVTTLVSGTLEQGRHFIRWNAAGAPSGVYFYRLQSGSFSSVRRLMLLK